MTAIPLGISAYERTASFHPEVRLVNMFLEPDESGVSPDKFYRLQRPGLKPYQTVGASTVRGIFYSEGVGSGLPLVTVSNKLYSINGSTSTILGTIANDGGITPMAANAFTYAILSAGTVYLWNGTTFSTLLMDDGDGGTTSLEPIIALDVINSYFILATSSGKFYWLAPGDTVVDPLAYADAESSPDGLIGVKRLNDELFFFGVSTVEVWQTTGDADQAFVRAPSRQFDHGCMARDSIRAFDNSVMWVGNDGRVYRMGGEGPMRVSSSGIEERLASRSDEPSAWTFTLGAHEFYVLRIPGQGTFAYDALTRLWSEFASTGSTVFKPHVAATLDNGTVLCGDSASGKIWSLDATRSNDDGAVMERLVTGSIFFNGRPVRNDSITFVVGSSGNANLRLRIAEGGAAPSGAYTSIPIVAPMDNPSLFRLGAARQPVRTFEVSCVDDVRIRVSGALLNEGWR